MAINQTSAWNRYLQLSFLSDEQEISFEPELHVEFSIEKTRASEPNAAVITVYNLSRETRAQLKTTGVDRTRAEYKRVRLVGGYAPLGVPPTDLLFDGYIHRAYSYRDGPDIATVIEAGDGSLDYRNAVVNRSFEAGTPYSEIVDYIRSQMPNVGVGNLSGVSQMGVTDKAYTLAGWAKRYLDEICRKFDCRWSIQNGALEILSNSEGIDRTVPLIRPSECLPNGSRTGGTLIGIPVVTEKGVSVTTLLSPQIRPNVLITVQSNELDVTDFDSDIDVSTPQVFRVNNVRHEGSNFAEDYYTIAECQRADGEVVRTVHNGSVNV